MTRIDRFISEMLCMTRSQAQQAIRSGRVLINGSRCRPQDKADEDADTVSFDGREIKYNKYIGIMLNKPKGVICATKDRLSDTVSDLIPPELRRRDLFPAGRLDKDTTGFVFITNNGALAHDMLSPRHHTEKEYEVTLRDPLSDADKMRYEETVAAGMTIDGDEKCLPARIVFTDDPKFVHLVLCEGKFHQVKRMMHTLGNEVTELRRIRIGGVWLDDALCEGQCREMTAAEIEQICTKH
ncbi:MAG: 16S rRNA pseudouridine(516) synthase [Oscillospiraceae bacterium]|nr:16S rRNA pseudouridine(516) synthase [Oscillospiraceae bacterium]